MLDVVNDEAMYQYAQHDDNVTEFDASYGMPLVEGSQRV